MRLSDVDAWLKYLIKSGEIRKTDNAYILQSEGEYPDTITKLVSCFFTLVKLSLIFIVFLKFFALVLPFGFPALLDGRSTEMNFTDVLIYFRSIFFPFLSYILLKILFSLFLVKFVINWWNTKIVHPHEFQLLINSETYSIQSIWQSPLFLLNFLFVFLTGLFSIWLDNRIIFASLDYNAVSNSYIIFFLVTGSFLDLFLCALFSLTIWQILYMKLRYFRIRYNSADNSISVISKYIVGYSFSTKEIRTLVSEQCYFLIIPGVVTDLVGFVLSGELYFVSTDGDRVFVFSGKLTQVLASIWELSDIGLKFQPPGKPREVSGIINLNMFSGEASNIIAELWLKFLLYSSRDNN